MAGILYPSSQLHDHGQNQRCNPSEPTLLQTRNARLPAQPRHLPRNRNLNDLFGAAHLESTTTKTSRLGPNGWGRPFLLPLLLARILARREGWVRSRFNFDLLGWVRGCDGFGW